MDGVCCVCFCCRHSPIKDVNVSIFWVHAMEGMCAQTRPQFILSSKTLGEWSQNPFQGEKISSTWATWWCGGTMWWMWWVWCGVVWWVWWYDNMLWWVWWWVICCGECGGCDVVVLRGDVLQCSVVGMVMWCGGIMWWCVAVLCGRYGDVMWWCCVVMCCSVVW